MRAVQPGPGALLPEQALPGQERGRLHGGIRQGGLAGREEAPRQCVLDEAQNIVNITCSVRAVRKLDLAKIKTAAVFGPGNAGLIILQLLKLGGVEKVVMVGTRDFRLENGKRFGCDYVVNVRREDPIKKIMACSLRRRCHIRILGNGGGPQGAFDAVKSNGSVVVFGIIGERMKEFDPSFLYLKEPIIYGSKGGAGMADETLDCWRRKSCRYCPWSPTGFPWKKRQRRSRSFRARSPMP